MSRRSALGRRAFDLPGLPVAFVVNRSTDFFWASGDFAALRKAYEAGAVYAAPNPFTYATRSDKGLMEWLSSPRSGRRPRHRAGERRISSAHVPETHVLRADNAEMLARRKARLRLQAAAWICEPRPHRQRRGRACAAAPARQCKATAMSRRNGSRSPACEVDGERLWTDLRVWAYRRRNPPLLRTRVAAAGPARSRAAGRLAADLCFAVRDPASAQWAS